VDFLDKTWNIVEKEVVWEPATPMVKDKNMAEIFLFLKFGQSGATLLADENIMISAEQGPCMVAATRIEI